MERKAEEEMHYEEKEDRNEKKEGCKEEKKRSVGEEKKKNFIICLYQANSPFFLPAQNRKLKNKIVGVF